MHETLCDTCKDAGILRKGNFGGRCFDHRKDGQLNLTIPIEKQAQIAEDSDTMSVRELVDKHKLSVNTVQKYMRKGPRDRVRAHFVDGDNGKWITLDNVIVTLAAERKTLVARIQKIDKAIEVLKKLQ